MKTLDEFKQYYEQQIVPELAPIEEKRARNARIFWCWMPVLFFPALFGSCKMYFIDESDNFWVPMLIFLLLAVGIYNWVLRSIRSGFKDAMIKKIVTFIDGSLCYHADSCIPEDVYEASGLFYQSYNRYRGDDLVSGRIGKTDIAFSEIHVKKVERRDNKEYTSTVFEGLFFIADFHKDFKGATYVFPDVAQNLFGDIVGQKLQNFFSTNGDLVKLEDPEFERYFAVYGRDQLEARYILSTSMMRRLINLREKAGQSIRVSFVSSKVYIALEYGELFEPNIGNSLLDFTQALPYFEHLQFFTGMVEDLDLNTRIWSKQ